MGIRFTCPSGHKLHVKEQLAGKRGICPTCGAKVLIPLANGPPGPAVVPSSDVVRGAVGSADATSSGPVSTMIPVHDPPPKPATVATEPVAIRTAPPPPPAEPVTLPAVATASVEIAPQSPVARYEAHRKRVRRNRTTIAVVLLVAVIILAAILIWVLQSGPTV